MKTHITRLTLVIPLALTLAACNGDAGTKAAREAKAAAEAKASPAPEVGTNFTIPTGREGVPPISVSVLAKGTGLQPRVGEKVSMHYIGTFLDGKQFDSSRAGGAPYEFRIGAGQAIVGWDFVASRMHVGDRWKVRIPAALAYGSRGHAAGIPPNADLDFDMELLAIK